MKVYGVIMAGGGGTRFWPLSRQKTPKQLLNLTGKELMVNEAIDRLANIADKDDIYIVTNAEQVLSMAEASSGRITPSHILSEPCARNTAACIGYAAIEILKKREDGIMVITPSDHYICDEEIFIKALTIAVKAAVSEDKLVTIGITPTFPATGFGYIKYDCKSIEEAKPVLEFKEKPDEETARGYLARGDYAWNSGMFIWKASKIIERFRMLVPDIYAALEEISNAMGTEREYKVIQAVYPTIRKISVDYAIMEPSAAAGEVLLIPGNFGWNDVGSWETMDILHKADKDGNIIIGDVIAINSTNSIAYSNGKLIAIVGVDNLVTVETPDAIMVCSKEKAQDVKLIVETLSKVGRQELL